MKGKEEKGENRKAEGKEGNKEKKVRENENKREREREERKKEGEGGKGMRHHCKREGIDDI